MIGDRVSILSLLRNTDESGQTMAEYAVVLGVITIAVVVTLGLLSTAISEPAEQRHRVALRHDLFSSAGVHPPNHGSDGRR